MQFDQNLFISYAHIDNEPVPPDEQGWITQFHRTLAPLLNMRLGKTATIWRDEKLQGNDVFGDEIVKRFNSSGVLISIVTSRYLNSEWCTREVREFCAVAKQRGGLSVDNKLRVFKVVKMPVDHEETLPAEMKQVLGYDFYTFKDGAPLELDPGYGDEYAKLYKQKCATLAWNVAQLLKAMEKNGEVASDAKAPGETAQAAKPSVYLAECSSDRRQMRETIEAELRRLGYLVLPDKPSPTDEAEYVAAVTGLLARCALSVHLVGENYGIVPDGATPKSVVMLQNDLAVERCRNGELERLIWLPKGTTSKHELHQAFIDSLNRDAEAQFGADLITGDLEELKAAIHATLKKIEQPDPPPVSAAEADAAEATSPDTGEKTKQLYVICDEKDLKPSIELRKFCKERGFDVARPIFEGDAGKVRKANQQLLASCDAILLYYGAGDEAWKRSIDNELRKLAGYRDKPLLAKSIYLAGPKTEDKQDLIDLDEPGLIDGFAGIPEAAMTAFLCTAGGVS